MKIREALTGPDKWCQGAFDKNEQGRALTFNERYKAYSRCLLGWINACYPDISERDTVVQKIRDHLRINSNLVHNYIAGWNDEECRIFDDVKNLVETLDI